MTKQNNRPKNDGIDSERHLKRNPVKKHETSQKGN